MKLSIQFLFSLSVYESSIRAPCFCSPPSSSSRALFPVRARTRTRTQYAYANCQVVGSFSGRRLSLHNDIWVHVLTALYPLTLLVYELRGCYFFSSSPSGVFFPVRVRSTRTQIARWQGHFSGRPFLLHNDILAVRVRSTQYAYANCQVVGSFSGRPLSLHNDILALHPYSISLLNFLIQFLYLISLFNFLIKLPY